MNQEKPGGGMGRGAPVEDPVLIRQAMRDLLERELEFPVKVEGAHTLPYTARLQHIDLGKGLLHLKLIRPLPHELALEAAFEMLFSVGDQRFEAPCIFKGREGYLLYRFTIPPLMAPSDRRRLKRYPFRPREKAYVVVQDGGVPGHVLSGPLVNLSLGGLAFRVDRVMRFDDHMRVTPGLGFFDRGKAFPMLKIRDLPNLPVFDARGVLAHALEGSGGIILGLEFGGLKENELRELQGVLTIREHMKRASAGTTSDGPRDTSPRSPATPKGPAARVAPAGGQTPDALQQLGRRSARIMLAMAPEPDRDEVHQALRAAGFLRVETSDTLEQALEVLGADRHTSAPLLVVETHPEDGFSVAGILALRKEFGDAKELPVALISREGLLEPSEDPLLRSIPWPRAEDATWLPLLDELAGLD